MKTLNRSTLVFIIILVLFSLYYWSATPSVPFHPDESTYLFTSGDFELFWQNPSNIYWKSERAGDIRQHYRLLDAPLLKNLIGLTRWVLGFAPLPVDWDWGKSWNGNIQLGSFPSPALLLSGRVASAGLFPFSLFFFFLAARKISGELGGWSAAVLLASNSLILLHTRRAMAEGPLLFTICLTLWAITHLEKQSLWISLPSAMAFSAKQTLAALSPVGLLAALWPAIHDGNRPIRALLIRAGLYASFSILLIWVLHPFMWGDPIHAAVAAIDGRREIITNQSADRPEQVLNSIPRKLAGMIVHLYIAAPQFSETANYQNETKAAEEAYLANPFNALFRSLPGGMTMISLNLFGFLMAVLSALREKGQRRRLLVLLLLANTLQALVLFVMIPLPWQRYYIPLVPFVCLWTAFGFERLRQDASKMLNSRHPVRSTN